MGGSRAKDSLLQGQFLFPMVVVKDNISRSRMQSELAKMGWKRE
ncbi:hypothetical protein COLO4_06942 [Corchorus olitorius]|uniref:Uncharacterized protein n=1 Tax=Corchorus olitorius TaxID=93759 RepID=A0A1R3KLE8_9ROSI|nr:hypothetical protein COLO4_06942 [Corchorus olitorius]